MFHICSKSCEITFESVINQGPPCVRPVVGPKSSMLYGIFVFAQYFVSPPHCVRRIRLTKKCEHEKIGPQNSD